MFSQILKRNGIQICPSSLVFLYTIDAKTWKITPYQIFAAIHYKIDKEKNDKKKRKEKKSLFLFFFGLSVSGF